MADLRPGCCAAGLVWGGVWLTSSQVHEVSALAMQPRPSNEQPDDRWGLALPRSAQPSARRPCCAQPCVASAGAQGPPGTAACCLREAEVPVSGWLALGLPATPRL